MTERPKDALLESAKLLDRDMDTWNERLDAAFAFGVGALFGFIGTTAASFSAMYDYVVRRARKEGNLSRPNEIPSVTDMVMFEKREAFRPEFEQEQLKDDPPSDSYILNMRALGFDEEWAGYFWRAHWELPSLRDGFSMLHRLRRGRVDESIVFDDDMMKSLLKQQDVLAKYRERLRAIAYEPLTRVDLRRMYQLNALKKDEIYERYLDLGYNKDDAQLLTDFAEQDTYEERLGLSQAEVTAAWIADIIKDDEFNEILTHIIPNERGRAIYSQLAATRKVAKDKPPQDRALTKADVVDSFEYGIITRQKALEYLVQLGYDMDESETLLKLKEAKSKKLKK